MLSHDHMHRMVHRYLAAINAADLDALMELFSAQASVEDPVGSAPLYGKPAIRTFYASVLPLRLHLQLEGEIRAVANEAAFAFSGTFQHEGTTVEIHPIDHFRFDAKGLIKHMRAWLGQSNMRPASI